LAAVHRRRREPNLEKILPPVKAPPTITGHDFAMTAPPALPKSPSVQERIQAPPPQQPIRQAVVPKRASQQNAAEKSDGPAREAPSPVTKTATDYSSQPAQRDYLWQIIRKLSQSRFYPQSREESERGVVVARLTVARDGRLIDVSLAKSSGFPRLDRSVMDTIRKASPFAPLPAEIGVDSHTFIVPINYER
jgi:TonB family protein